METKSIITFMFHLQIIIDVANLAIAQSPNPKQPQLFKCRNTGDFNTELLKKQRDLVLNALSKNLRNPYTGYNHEQDPSRDGVVSAIVLCPSNIKAEACEDCIKKTIPYLTQNCPKQKEGVAWTLTTNFDSCMLLFSDRHILAMLDDWVWASFWNPQTGANIGELEKAIDNLANKLKDQAVSGNFSLIKFASGTVTYGSGSTTLYGSMQCTPFLSKEDCKKCLSTATIKIHDCCTGKGRMSGRMMSPNCYYRYAHENFTPKNSSSIYGSSPRSTSNSATTESMMMKILQPDDISCETP